MTESTNQKKERQPKKGQRGQALVEFALVALAFITLVFSVLEGALLFQSWVTLQHASREGARYAVTGRVNCDGITEDRAACIAQTAIKATTGLSGGGISGSDVTVSFKKWDYPDYSGSGISNNPGDQCDAIEVRVDYTHSLIFPPLKLIAPSGIDLAGRQRMVNEPFGPCI